jgi:hypothetical protein
MSITIPPEDFLKAPEQARLPGEPRRFKALSFRNLTPPQHWDGAQITSSRPEEVTHGTDPLLLRIRELEAEIAVLRTQLEPDDDPT